MSGPDPDPRQAEIDDLRLRLEEAEQTLEAIRAGEVDSILVDGPGGLRVYQLDSGGNSYRVLVEAMSEGAATVTPDGVILYANERLGKMLGRPLERVMGGSVLDLVPPRLRDALDGLLRSAAAAEARSELALLGEDGEEIPAFLSLNGIDYEGQRTVCFVATDLREQKRTEEVLAAERFARSVLQQAAEAIVVCDASGRVVRASVAAEELSRRSPLLAPFDEVFPLVLRAGPFTGSVAAAALGGDTVRGASAGVTRRDGSWTELLVSAAPVQGSDGEVVGAIITMADVTEHRRAEEALRLADRRKNEFLGVLSHELRNPLTPIRNSIYLLDRLAPDSPQARRAREVIRRQTDHLARLVDDLLDITRISHGKVTLDWLALDLRDVVRQVCDDHASLFAQGGIELRVSLPEAPVSIQGDALRLSQIVGNLLQNAAKFTPRDGRVDVTLSERGAEVVLSVRDTGIGLDPADVERLFEPFAQADRSLARTRGGLGLGLALVKAVAELHGGSAQAHSEGLGQGAEFSVILPLSRSASR